MNTNQLATLVLSAFVVTGCGEHPRLSHLAPSAQTLRPTEPTGPTLGRFAPEEVVERVCSVLVSVCVHFTREGLNAVPAADADRDGVPDFVTHTLEVYEAAWRHYVGALGLRAPLSDAMASNDGGGEELDVYLVDFGGIGGGQFVRDACLSDAPHRCSGFIAQENDFSGYGYAAPEQGSTIVSSHELFHAVQAAYRVGLPVTPSEASAVWATESFEPSLDDFERFLPGFFNEPTRSLVSTSSGPVPAHSYGSAIFFRYLEERFGAAIIRGWLEGLDASPDVPWTEPLEDVLEARGVLLPDAWAEHAVWAFFTAERAQEQVDGFREGARYPSLAMRSLTPPFREPIRVFPLSLRPLELAPFSIERAEIGFDARAGDPSGVLKATWLSERAPGWSIEARGLAESVELDGAGVTRSVVLLTHGVPDADTVRPTLCVDARCLAASPSSQEAGDGCSIAGAHAAPLAELLAILMLIMIRNFVRRMKKTLNV